MGSGDVGDLDGVVPHTPAGPNDQDPSGLAGQFHAAVVAQALERGHSGQGKCRRIGVGDGVWQEDGCLGADQALLGHGAARHVRDPADNSLAR
jgi:hypothetical protein